MMTAAMILTPVILAILARNDLGESRFYGALETAGIMLVVIVLGVVVAAYSLVLIRVRGEAQAKIEAARRPQEVKHVYHERTHTIDGRGTFNVAGGDPLTYPDLVRQLLSAQQPAGAAPQLPAPSGYAVQLPAPAQRIEDVAPVVDELPGWTPYSGMASEW